MTYSIVARDQETGELGVAVQSHYFGAGTVVPWARAGVGVVATQSVADPGYGPRLLALLEQGVDPVEALERERRADPHADLRQVAVLDAHGRGASFTGSSCIGWAGASASANARAQANLVASPRIWDSMTDAFENARGRLADRLLAALLAAESHGGDLRGRQAGAILVVRGEASGDLLADVVTDVRVDDSDDPHGELRRLLDRSTALACLIPMLATDGLLSGPFTATPDATDTALDVLADAQHASGPGNHEATVWRGLLLARAGREHEARAAFDTARESTPLLDDLLRQLADSGMWHRPLAELDALLSTDRKETT